MLKYLTIFLLFSLAFAIPLDGCSVLSSPGEYTLTNSLTDPNITAGEISGLTCLKINSSDVSIDCANYNLTNTISEGTNITTAIYARAASSLSNITIQNCLIYNYSAIGIRYDNVLSGAIINNTIINTSNGDAIDTLSSSNLLIANNILADNFFTGLYTTIISDPSENISFIGNEVYGSLTSIIFETSSNITASNNILHDSTSEYGVSIFQSPFIYMYDNYIYNTPLDGIWIGGSYNSIFARNNFSTISDYCFNIFASITPTENNTFVGNNLDSCQIGFYASSSINNLFENNTINNTNQGIDLTSSSNTTIKNNTINNTVQDGIRIDSGLDDLITFNMIDLGSSGMYIRSNNSLIENNLIINTPYALLVGGPDGSDTRVLSNNILNISDGIGIYPTGVTNITIDNNTVMDGISNSVLIYIEVLSNSTISNNLLTNAETGILLQPNNILNNTIFSNSISLMTLRAIDSRGGPTTDATTFDSNQIFSSNTGHYSQNINNTLIRNDHYYNNTVDMNFTGSGSLSLENVIIDNPAGNYQNYTNLSLTDIMESDTYALNWSSTPTPPLNITPLGKSIYITLQNTIDKVTWTYSSNDIIGLSASNLSIWYYNGTWTKANSTTNTTQKLVTLENISDIGIYSLLTTQEAQVPFIDPLIPLGAVSVIGVGYYLYYRYKYYMSR